MTRPTLEKTGDNLKAHDAAGTPSELTSLTSSYDIFNGWRAEYNRLHSLSSPSEGYLPLGNKMLQWCKEAGLWGHIEQDVRKLGLLELRVTERSKNGLLFLELPWEILADENGFLADRAGKPFCPVRRVGKPATPPDPVPYKLSIAFMASSPRHVTPVLNFEQEEADILRAAKNTSLDLSVDETGCLEFLVDHIAELGKELPNGHMGVDVLHISCHGKVPKEGEPHLLMEDEFGDLAEVDAREFIHQFGTEPRALFLSACQTGKTPELTSVSGSFASSCVDQGMPAVLGWGESVNDLQATLFEAELYRQLSRGETLETAVAMARYGLLQPGQGQEAFKHWHLARLYLGPDGGGVLANGRKSRLGNIGRDHGTKEFLDKEGQQVPVASRYEFVGRRRQIQAILREFRDEEHAGVFIHGTGGQGKSSLAARVANRMPRHTTVVIYGPKEHGGDQSAHYDGSSIFEALAKNSPTKLADKVETFRAQINENQSRLLPVFRELLQALEDSAIPILLVVDDFEQALKAPAAQSESIHTVKSNCAPGIAALIEAFEDRRGSGESRLLFTSRHKFTLPTGGRDLAAKLLFLNLPPMKEVESKKQAAAQKAPDELILDEDLQDRIFKAVKGNPGLQRRLFSLGKNDAEACNTAVAALEAYLNTGEDPNQDDVREHLNDIFAKTTFDLLNDGERNVLRASTVFRLPIAAKLLSEVAVKLCLAKDADTAEKCFDRLVAFGLWDSYSDPFANGKVSFAVAPLAAPRATGGSPLSEAEISKIAETVLPGLFTHWGGEDGSKRLLPYDEELFRLGLLAKNAQVLNACGANALRSMKDSTHYGELAELALAAMGIIKDAGLKATPRLLYITAEVAQQGGKTKPARDLAHEAVQVLEQVKKGEKDSDSQLQLASARLRLANLHTQFGEPDLALTQLEKASAEFESLGLLRDKAIASGDIARIYRNKGKVDEALKLHEEMRTIFEELGDRRSRAVTLGDIARIYVDKGRVDEALKLHEEQIAVYEELGDRRERAVTLGDIARIYVSKGRVDEALKLHEEMRTIFEELGDRRSRAVTLGDIARIYVSKGKVDDALKLHEEQIAVYEELGDRRERAVTLGDIARIYVSKGKVDDALKLHEEQIAVYEELGDRRERALTLGDIARIYVSKGRVDEALKLHEEQIAVYEELGDRRELSATYWDLTQAYMAKEDMAKVAEYLPKAYAIVEQLGDVQGMAVVGKLYGQLLFMAGQRDEGLQVVQRSVEGYAMLGQTEQAENARQLLKAMQQHMGS